MTATESNFANPHFGEIPLQNVIPSKTNPRKHFDDVALNELADSIKSLGLAQPILVRPLPTTAQQIDCVEIVCGERRYRASKLAGKTHIMAVCRDMTDDEVLKLQLIENLQRKDVHEIEEAEGYERLMKDLKISAVQIAKEVGKSREYIYGRLKLCALTPANRELFYAGKLNASTALLVARIPVAKLQDQAGAEITKEIYSGDVMSYRQAQQYITNRYTLDLAGATFNIKDTKLVKSAGACIKCPKRTGAQPEIYTDLSADVCTDPDCFQSKNAAHADQIAPAATKSASPTEPVLKSTGSQKSVERNLEGEKQSDIEATSTTPKASQAHEEMRARRADEETEYRFDIFNRLIQATLSEGVKTQVLRMAVRFMLKDSYFENTRIERRFNPDEEESAFAYIDGASAVELQALIVDLMFNHVLTVTYNDIDEDGSINDDNPNFKDFISLARWYRIDVDTIRQEYVATPSDAIAEPAKEAEKKTKPGKQTKPVAAWPYPTSAQMAAKEAA